LKSQTRTKYLKKTKTNKNKKYIFRLKSQHAFEKPNKNKIPKNKNKNKQEQKNIFRLKSQHVFKRK